MHRTESNSQATRNVRLRDRRPAIHRPVLWIAMLALAGATLLSACGGGSSGDRGWLTSWAASHNRPEAPANLSDSTVRMIVRPTAAGSAVRVRIENTVGTAPVTFSDAYVGVAGAGATVDGSNMRMTFNGNNTLTLAPGTQAWSDTVNMSVQAFQRLAVSLHASSATNASAHTLGLTTTYIARGNLAETVGSTGFSPVNPIMAGTSISAYPVYWVGAVDVMSSTRGTIVTLGDSITDGTCSTTTNGGTLAGGVVVMDRYQRWNDILADRLAALPEGQQKAVANAGIVGNRVVTAGGFGPSAVDRLDRDVLALSGVSHVIFFEGTNDILGGASTGSLIAGSQQVLDRLRARGLKVIAGTIMPRGAATGGFTAEQEQVRLDVNAWIRTPGRFDGVIDFDALMVGDGKSPTGAAMLKPEFNCDNTHPNVAGYAAIGNAINLDLFKN